MERTVITSKEKLIKSILSSIENIKELEFLSETSGLNNNEKRITDLYLAAEKNVTILEACLVKILEENFFKNPKIINIVDDYISYSDGSLKGDIVETDLINFIVNKGAN